MIFMHPDACNKPFNPCGGCPHKESGSPTPKRTKFIVDDGNSNKKHLIELTDEQVRFLKWLQDNDLLWDDISFESTSSAEWESI
jgi:hypothetical protein